MTPAATDLDMPSTGLRCWKAVRHSAQSFQASSALPSSRQAKNGSSVVSSHVAKMSAPVRWRKSQGAGQYLQPALRYR
jgi:hypothetical protein